MSRAGGVRGVSRHVSGSSQRSSYEERCVDPIETLADTEQPRSALKAHPRDANGNKCETIGFIPGSAERGSESPTCNPCSSPQRCRTVFCTVLTCGLYRVCHRSVLAPCLAPTESSPDEPEKVSLKDTKTRAGREEEDGDWDDLRIAGVRVEEPIEYTDEPHRPLSSSRVSSTGAVTHFSHSSLPPSMVLDDWDEADWEDEGDVDSLIRKKLLILYSEYQIEELARCTSDSVFLKKTKDIHHLINSLVEEHQMDEQEAECRLVRGIIRISTRRSKMRPPTSREERTLSDSGHETMKESGSHSFSNNNDYKSNPNIQISDLTSSDKYARQMWRNNGGQSSMSPTTYSPSTTDTSSGVPLLRSVRT